jgi:hypothetical protein
MNTQSSKKEAFGQSAEKNGGKKIKEFGGNKRT